jgi:hypothetical protein
MEKYILVATLPIATSANSSYGSNGRGGKRLTRAAVDYTDHVLAILNYRNAIHGGNPPYKVHHIDMEAIEFIRNLKTNKSRSKKVLELHKYYSIEEDLYVPDWNAVDIDNPHKLQQDVLSSWIGFNDNRMVETHTRKVVIKGCVPCVDVVVKQRDAIQGRGQGALVWEAMTAIELGKMYAQPYYGDNGEKKIDCAAYNVLDTGRQEDAM